MNPLRGATAEGTPLRTAAVVVGLAAAYFLAGKLGLALAFVHMSASAVWPPTGIAIAAVLLLGPRVWPGIAAGAFLVNLTTSGDVPTSLGIAAGNALEALLACFLVTRCASGKDAFHRLPDIVRFAVLAGLVAPAVGATVGVTSLVVGGLAPPSAFADVWLTWWLGDAAGALVVAPLLVLLATSPRPTWSRAQVTEGVAVLASVFLIGGVVFGLPPLTGLPLGFLALLPILWAAFRFGPRMTALSTALLASLAIFGTLQGLGPFHRPSPNVSLLMLQAFLCVSSVTGLALAAVVQERRRAEASLRAAHADLEKRVGERTASLSLAIEALRTEMEERSRAQGELRRSQASLAEAERIANVGSWEWDIAADRVTWSDELHRIYGLDPASFRATYAAFLEAIHPKDRARVQAIITDAYAAHTPFDFEHRIVRPGGEVRVLHAKGAVVLDAAERPVRMTGTGQDITERIEAQRTLEQLKELERLKEMDRFKTQFLNVAAHELSTPLTPIRLQLAILRRNVEASALPREMRSLDILDRNVGRLSDLVHDVLEATRLQAGRLSIKRTMVDLDMAVREVAESFQAPAGDGGVQIECRCAPGLRVEADPARIHQVLPNLLSNAWKFTPDGGLIVVEASAEGGEAVVRVTDTGPGLTREAMTRLFQPFSQVHEEPARVPGTGLGLFISRAIIELHGGRIWAESDGPGQGSTFSFALPLAPHLTVTPAKGSMRDAR